MGEHRAVHLWHLLRVNGREFFGGEMTRAGIVVAGAFVFGGLAIIFALLSRGARKKTYGAAHTALLIGTAGVLISVVITIGSFITVSRQYGGFDKFLERYTYTLEQNFGIDLDPGSDNSSTDNGSDGTSIFDNNGSGDYL